MAATHGGSHCLPRAVDPEVRELPSRTHKRARRGQFVGMLTQEKNRFGFALKPGQKGLQKHLDVRAACL